LPGKRGVSRSSRTRGRMRWTQKRRRETVVAGRVSRERCRRAGRTAQTRTAKPCGSGTRCWCQVGGGFSGSTGPDKTFNPPTTVTKRIRRREEHGISRKAITQGMPDASASPVCSCAHFLVHLAHETAGAACTRHSLRPLVFEGEPNPKTRAHRAARARWYVP